MNDTKKILKKYNLRLDKNKSQNYLIDSNKVKFILEHADIQSDEVILEIGAGIGTLTIPMAKKAKKVIAIEKDPVICDVLRQRIIQEKLGNVELINDDARLRQMSENASAMSHPDAAEKIVSLIYEMAGKRK